MESLSFGGRYVDADGSESITWLIRDSDRLGYAGRYEIATTIRGVGVWGSDFDGLEPADATAQGVREVLHLNRADELVACVLSGDLPCVAEVGEQLVAVVVHFELDLSQDPNLKPGSPENLRLSTVLNGTEQTVLDDWFEDGVLRLDEALRPHRLRCCVTCLYSDYSPGGHGLMGMRCHRDAREQYLGVRSKADYWSVPVTEEVPETYLCDQYRARVPGTGYRG